MIVSKVIPPSNGDTEAKRMSLLLILFAFFLFCIALRINPPITAIGSATDINVHKTAKMNIPAAGNRHSGKTETANPAQGNRWSSEMKTIIPVGGSRLCEA